MSEGSSEKRPSIHDQSGKISRRTLLKLGAAAAITSVLGRSEQRDQISNFIKEQLTKIAKAIDLRYREPVRQEGDVFFNVRKGEPVIDNGSAFIYKIKLESGNRQPINIRSSPGLRYGDKDNVITQLPSGTVFEGATRVWGGLVIGSDLKGYYGNTQIPEGPSMSDWFKIDYQGREAYVSSQQVTVEGEPVEIASISTTTSSD